MLKLRNPKWIFILNTVPIILIFILFYEEYSIINSQLDEININYWKSFGWILFLLGALSFGYGIYALIAKRKVNVYYSVLALVLYIPFIYIYSFNSEKVIPFSIPQWMLLGEMVVYVGTLLMPTLTYSLFVLVTHFTPNKKNHIAGKDFLFATLIPITWYLFSQIILPLWKPLENNYSVHVLLILTIIATILFLFFIIRGVFIIAKKRAKVWRKYQLTWKIPISIILPLLGLAVNNGILDYNFDILNSGIFGNFNNPWFYILATLNGILICMPNIPNKIYRLFLFFGRSILFSFTFYFFIVFLPFLPLSVIAIVAFGIGFLMLTPLLLLVIHVNELFQDFKFLQTHFSNSINRINFLLGFLIIPILITVNYLDNKKNLNITLDYLYNPDYSKEYNIDSTSLSNTLKILKGHKSNNGGGIFGGQQPYLTPYFNWLVLDNLTLSDAKINKIQRIFFDTPAKKNRRENILNKNVKISDLSTTSNYNNIQNSWTSWINLEITNKNEHARFSEYATTFELPEGTWISNYYLNVGDKKEIGILAEKKSAKWVFSSIRNQNRDPGILYYLTGNKVAFRVFPFEKNQVRKTGIELLHKEPIQIVIDGHNIQLGENNKNHITSFANESIAYISTKQKKNLKTVFRKPYFHFMLDVSDKEKVPELISRIDHIKQQYATLAKNGKISLVDHNILTLPMDKYWNEKLKNNSFSGGFYLDRAIKSSLFLSYKQMEARYPVIVVVTDRLQEAIIDKDFSDWKFSFPESHLFYNLNSKSELEFHSLISNPLEPIKDSSSFSFNYPTLEYNHGNDSKIYLPNDNKASFVIKSDIIKFNDEEVMQKDWESALTMQGNWTSQILHPETNHTEWLKLVKNSFISQIMTPVTSYLVVENDAQKAILKKKQAQVLASQKSLDLGEDTQSMSEPNFIILIILMGLFLWYKQKQDNQIKLKNN